MEEEEEEEEVEEGADLPPLYDTQDIHFLGLLCYFPATRAADTTN